MATTDLSVLVFRTNVNNAQDLALVAPRLNNHPNLLRWTIDQQDIDKVLRVETHQLTPSHITTLLNQAGYHCQELPD